MWFMGLKICMGDEHHRYYKHTTNPRGDLTNFTWNDPYIRMDLQITASTYTEH